MASTPHMVDEFEKAFQNSLALLSSQEHFNIETDADEIKLSVEQSVQKFTDAVRHLDTFFMQKHLLCSVKTDSSPAKEDLDELRAEVQRKDALIQKHWEKLQLWQSWMRHSPGSQGIAASGASPGQSQGQPGVQPQQQPAPGAQQQQQGTFAPGLMAPGGGGQPAGYSQAGPLAYLEQTTSSIGLPRIN